MNNTVFLIRMVFDLSCAKLIKPDRTNERVKESSCRKQLAVISTSCYFCTQNHYDMQKNYRFEILSFLFSHLGGPVNMAPFIKDMCSEGVFSEFYFLIQLEAMQANELIGIETSGTQMKTRLLPDGITEYHRLKLRCISFNRHPQNNSVCQ